MPRAHSRPAPGPAPRSNPPLLERSGLAERAPLALVLECLLQPRAAVLRACACAAAGCRLLLLLVQEGGKGSPFLPAAVLVVADMAGRRGDKTMSASRSRGSRFGRASVEVGGEARGGGGFGRGLRQQGQPSTPRNETGIDRTSTKMQRLCCCRRHAELDLTHLTS